MEFGEWGSDNYGLYDFLDQPKPEKQLVEAVSYT